MTFTDQQVADVLCQYQTPFYLYDEATIRQRVRELKQAFAWNEGFREYFAVKALPNPAVLEILRQEGCGADCASGTELTLAQNMDIMFTSNNTPAEEFVQARELGAIINLDSLEMVDFLAQTAGIPEVICCRYAPATEVGSANQIMGEAGQSKFGMRRDQVFTAFERLRELGATRFGVHCMAASNSLNNDYYPALARELFDLAVEIRDRLGIEVEFLNFAGGLGIPYRPEDQPLDLAAIGAAVRREYETRLQGLKPAIFTELGRYLVGPAGALVTTVRHLKHSYKYYVGVDASATDLLRPAMYGAYHHITVVGKDQPADHPVDVVGSLCENNDKFAIDRWLPEVEPGDVLLIHDAGAHGYSMGYNYNGKLRGGEVLLGADGQARMIRRPQSAEDYFATLTVQ
ncbi:diaminopimelate decarboxylase [Scrofimicrobium sp. R131]|uniref:Diaminopimelate decarboxylase n=1 Tax=Scrofimicrobium appendicitidis TaxID=3079930 RepID=A0AAU7V7S2_9ACTO